MDVLVQGLKDFFFQFHLYFKNVMVENNYSFIHFFHSSRNVYSISHYFYFENRIFVYVQHS